MIIRQLTPDDIYGHMLCSSQAFCYTIGDPAKETLDRHDFAPGAFDEETGELLAEIEVDRYFSSFCGKSLDCAAIGGVASRPEHRNKGAVRAIFEDFFVNHALQEGYEISILYPFSTAYYRKFGYETAGTAMDMSIPFTELAHIPRSCSVELFDGSQLEALLELFNTIAAKTNLSFIRKDGHYFPGNYLQTGRYIYLWKNAEGKYRGYVNYTVDRGNSVINVSEIGFIDKEALLGLIGFLRTYDGNQKTLHFEKLPVSSPILNIVRNEHDITRKCYNMGAVRILDLMSVLSKKAWPEKKGHFTFKAIDIIKENDGVFSVDFECGKAEVKRTDAEPDVILEPNAFSKLFLTGIPSPEAAEYIPGCTVLNKESDIFKAFRPDEAFFCDGF